MLMTILVAISCTIVSLIVGLYLGFCWAGKSWEIAYRKLFVSNQELYNWGNKLQSNVWKQNSQIDTIIWALTKLTNVIKERLPTLKPKSRKCSCKRS